MEHRSLALGQFRSGKLTVNCSDPDPYAIRLLSRLLKLEERRYEISLCLKPTLCLGEPRRLLKILLQYLSRLDETSHHSNQDDMTTSTREETQDEEKNSILTTASAKQEDFLRVTTIFNCSINTTTFLSSSIIPLAKRVFVHWFIHGLYRYDISTWRR